MPVAQALSKKGILLKDCKHCVLKSTKQWKYAYNIIQECSKGSKDTEQTRARGLLHIHTHKHLLQCRGISLGKQVFNSAQTGSNCFIPLKCFSFLQGWKWGAGSWGLQQEHGEAS